MPDITPAGARDASLAHVSSPDTKKSEKAPPPPPPASQKAATLFSKVVIPVEEDMGLAGLFSLPDEEISPQNAATQAAAEAAAIGQNPNANIKLVSLVKDAFVERPLIVDGTLTKILPDDIRIDYDNEKIYITKDSAGSRFTPAQLKAALGLHSFKVVYVSERAKEEYTAALQEEIVKQLAILSEKAAVLQAPDSTSKHKEAAVKASTFKEEAKIKSPKQQEKPRQTQETSRKEAPLRENKKSAAEQNKENEKIIQANRKREIAEEKRIERHDYVKHQEINREIALAMAKLPPQRTILRTKNG